VGPKATMITFGPFRLLPAQRQLWKGEQQIEVRQMSLAVLTSLAQPTNSLTRASVER
jgi:hypothetical protein